MENLFERGLPLSLSRWTDVAHWYLPWLRDLITRQGFLFAPDPESGLMQQWSLDPDDVYALYFWTKHPSALISPLLTWLSPYRVFVVVTITMWDEVEPRAPDFEVQITGLRNLVELIGPDLVRLRISPVPTDLLVNSNRYEKYITLLRLASELGLSLDVSLLHDPSSSYDGFKRIQVLETLCISAQDHSVDVGFCGQDALLMQSLPLTYRSAECLDARQLSSVFQLPLKVKKEAECACLLSVDPCLGPRFGCGSGCTYCYAPYTRS